MLSYALTSHSNLRPCLSFLASQKLTFLKPVFISTGYTASNLARHTGISYADVTNVE